MENKVLQKPTFLESKIKFHDSLSIVDIYHHLNHASTDERFYLYPSGFRRGLEFPDSQMRSIRTAQRLLRRPIAFERQQRIVFSLVSIIRLRVLRRFNATSPTLRDYIPCQ